MMKGAVLLFPLLLSPLLPRRRLPPSPSHHRTSRGLLREAAKAAVMGVARAHRNRAARRVDRFSAFFLVGFSSE